MVQANFIVFRSISLHFASFVFVLLSSLRFITFYHVNFSKLLNTRVCVGAVCWMYRNRLSLPSTSENMLSITSSEVHIFYLYQISRQDLQCYLVYRKIIHSIQHSPSWELNNSSARQEIPRVLWNKKFHFLVNINPLLVPVLKQINPFHALNSISWKYILISSSLLCLGLPSVILPADLPTEMPYVINQKTETILERYFTSLYVLLNNNCIRNSYLLNEVTLWIIWGP